MQIFDYSDSHTTTLLPKRRAFYIQTISKSLLFTHLFSIFVELKFHLLQILAFENTVKMQKSLIWDVIKQFSTQECRDFRRFLRSPYFNTREDLLALFEYLVENRNLNVPPKRELVFAETFPEKKFDRVEMRLMLSYLFRLLEQFLRIEENEKDIAEQKSTLLSIYKSRSLNRQLRKTLNQSQKLHNNSNQQHPEFYLEAYYLEKEEYEILSSAGRTQELNLQQVEDNLDSAFISFKLRQACLTRAHEAVFNTQYDVRLLHELLQIAQTDFFQKVPAIVIYSYCYRALYNEPTEENFRLFREKLIEVTPLFPPSEIRTLYLLAINYCIKQINKTKLIYLQEALDLYKSGLENNLLLENGFLSRHAFNNIVGIALRLDDFVWTETFVNEYKDALPLAYRAAAFQLNSGRLAYAQKEYQSALAHLQKSDYRDILDNMVAKILQMKIYYETDEFDLLQSHLKTVEMYIRRNKKISYHYENWRNIIRYTQKIVEVNRFDKKAVEKLKAAIKGEGILTEKGWLLQQL